MLWPLFFATVAFLLYGADDERSRWCYAALGAAVMGIWSVVTATASGLLQRRALARHARAAGGLADPLRAVLVPITTAMASLGLFSLVSTLLWGRLLFGIDVPIEHPLAVRALDRGVDLLDRAARLPALGRRRALPHRLGDGQLLEYPAGCCAASWCRWPVPGLGHRSPGCSPDVGDAGDPGLGARGSPLPDIVLCLVVGLAYGVVGALLPETCSAPPAATRRCPQR